MANTLNISKELLEKIYTNKDLTIKEKLKVLGCSDNYMYKKLKEYGIPTNNKTKPTSESAIIPIPEIESEVTIEASVQSPEIIAYNLNLTVRFKPENKEDFFTALELLKDTLQ